MKDDTKYSQNSVNMECETFNDSHIDQYQVFTNDRNTLRPVLMPFKLVPMSNYVCRYGQDRWYTIEIWLMQMQNYKMVLPITVHNICRHSILWTTAELLVKAFIQVLPATFFCCQTVMWELQRYSFEGFWWNYVVSEWQGQCLSDICD